METNINDIIQKYLTGITTEDFPRYQSWDYCFQAFGHSQKSENQILHLVVYLASWGMYRGSGGLLQKNYLVHRGAIDILYSDLAQKLKCNIGSEVTPNDIAAILNIKNQLSDHYNKINFIRGAEKPKPISTTDTLLSKIMLGTLGCVPAYDRYFIDGLKEMKMKHTSFNEDSLKELFNFIDDNKTEIGQAQKLIKTQTQTHYPLMKILDMYFWQIGYDQELNKVQS